MFEQNQSQLLANALSILAVILTASGIFVSTLPLESKRPANAEHAKFVHAGRQDVEARLWQDPFVVKQRIEGKTPKDRCDDAKKDSAHHPVTLYKLIERRGRGKDVTVLPVMVSGQPYFEDSESRRRSRYAVVTALLDSGWEPSDESKLGYVWTFESCIESPWLRWAPEILPWEWFSRKPSNGKQADSNSSDELWLRGKPRDGIQEELLVLWVDEDAISRHPLSGINEIVKLLAHGGIPCRNPGITKQVVAGKEPTRDKRRTEALQTITMNKELCSKLPNLTEANSCGTWRATRVLGPSTSDGLQGLARDLAETPSPHPGDHLLRFYSSGATAAADEEFLEDIIQHLRRSGAKVDDDSDRPPTQDELHERLHHSLLRLTVTDEKLASALVEELKLRLIDPNPFWRFTFSASAEEQALCDATIVIVAEKGVSYPDLFWNHLDERVKSACKNQLPRVRVLRKSYLRGVDGVLPDEKGAPVSPAQSASESAQARKDALLTQASRERADGRSQYDYLRRLAEDLAVLDTKERSEGRSGVRAIGVLGIDAYDRIVVLEALRERFRRAVFFTADLDARMMGADVTKWTRNLIVASAYAPCVRLVVASEI